MSGALLRDTRNLVSASPQARCEVLDERLCLDLHTTAWRAVSGCQREGHQSRAERYTESAPQHHQHRTGNQLFPKGGQRPEPVHYQLTPTLLVTVWKITTVLLFSVWLLVVLALGKLAANKAKCVYCHSSSSGLELDSSEGHHGLSQYPQPLRRVCAEGEAGREGKRLAPNSSSLQSTKSQGHGGLGHM